MEYIAEQCIPLTQVKANIAEGLFGDLKDVTDVKLYKNAKRQWRLKFTVENQTRTDKRSLNVLATVSKDCVYVNKKSLEFANDIDEENAAKLADILLS